MVENGIANRYGTLVELTAAGPVTKLQLPSSLTSAIDMAAGPDGALWITQYPDQAIGRYVPGGTFTAYPLWPLSHANEITAGPDGAMWFTDLGTNSIGRIAMNGRVDNYGLPTGPFANPYGIAVGGDRALWFAEEYGGRIGRITVSGRIQEFTIPNRHTHPQHVVAGTDGSLWFTDQGDASGHEAIGHVTLDGAVTEYPLPTVGAVPGDLALGPDGALWFSESRGRVGRVDPNGQPTPAATPKAVVRRAALRRHCTARGPGRSTRNAKISSAAHKQQSRTCITSAARRSKAHRR